MAIFFWINANVGLQCWSEKHKQKSQHVYETYFSRQWCEMLILVSIKGRFACLFFHSSQQSEKVRHGQCVS